MKKYKLKKDFPGSTIGDVWVKSDSGFMSPEGRESIKMHEHLFKPFTEWFEDYKDDDLSKIIRWVDKGLEDEVLPVSVNDFVEKLKAFKRLQDLGFKFEGVRFRNNHNYIEWKIEPKNELTDDEAGKLMEDLYEVFGGKE